MALSHHELDVFVICDSRWFCKAQTNDVSHRNVCSSKGQLQNMCSITQFGELVETLLGQTGYIIPAGVSLESFLSWHALKNSEKIHLGGIPD